MSTAEEDTVTYTIYCWEGDTDKEVTETICTIPKSNFEWMKNLLLAECPFLIYRPEKNQFIDKEIMEKWEQRKGLSILRIKP